jgi:hypothetical protein
LSIYRRTLAEGWRPIALKYKRPDGVRESDSVLTVTATVAVGVPEHPMWSRQEGVGLRQVRHKAAATRGFGGRKPGIPNKTTQVLKDALLDAASALGFPEEITLVDDDGKPTGVIKLKKTGVDGMTGYLEWLGLNHPHTFAALLGRVLPTQLNIKTTSSLKVTYKTVEEANKALREVGITDVMVNEILKLESPKKR